MRFATLLILGLFPVMLGCGGSQSDPMPITVSPAIGSPLSAKLTPGEPISISGDLAGNKDISGIGFLAEYLFLVSDETAHVEVLKKDGNKYQHVSAVKVGEGEIDFEAIAVDGNTVYALGSHSRVRPKQKPDDTYALAREKLATVDFVDSNRDVLAKFTFNPVTGEAGPVSTVSLRSLIESNPHLKPFAAIPSKENGVDIEGLAVKNGQLYVGFRGPVLRENFVPILVTTFSNPNAGELRFVNLNGRGVRDLATVSDGFLILAGPVGDGPGSYQVYHWNGNDVLRGANPPGSCNLLGEFPDFGDEKPEGLAVTAESPEGWELVLVRDGVKEGKPTRYKQKK